MRRSTQKLVRLLATIALIFSGCTTLSYEMNAIQTAKKGHGYSSVLSLGREGFLEFKAEIIAQKSVAAQNVATPVPRFRKQRDLSVMFSKYHRGNLFEKLSKSVLQEHFVDKFDAVLAKAQVNNAKRDAEETHSWEAEGKNGELTASWAGGQCVSFKLSLNDGNGFKYDTAALQYAEKDSAGWYTLSDYQIETRCE